MDCIIVEIRPRSQLRCESVWILYNLRSSSSHLLITFFYDRKSQLSLVHIFHASFPPLLCFILALWVVSARRLFVLFSTLQVLTLPLPKNCYYIRNQTSTHFHFYSRTKSFFRPYSCSYPHLYCSYCLYCWYWACCHWYITASYWNNGFVQVSVF